MTPTATTVAADIKAYAFPFELQVDVGTTVVWTNRDQVAHDVTSRDVDWASPLLGQDDSWAHTFEAPGRFAYVCTVHSYMTAVLIVR